LLLDRLEVTFGKMAFEGAMEGSLGRPDSPVGAASKKLPSADEMLLHLTEFQ
jgi:hypothetical protein